MTAGSSLACFFFLLCFLCEVKPQLPILAIDEVCASLKAISTMMVARVGEIATLAGFRQVSGRWDLLRMGYFEGLAR
ncbi:hypothetical protein Tco_0520341 [Tanacetum coccineum]